KETPAFHRPSFASSQINTRAGASAELRASDGTCRTLTAEPAPVTQTHTHTHTHKQTNSPNRHTNSLNTSNMNVQEVHPMQSKQEVHPGSNSVDMNQQSGFSLSLSLSLSLSSCHPLRQRMCMC